VAKNEEITFLLLLVPGQIVPFAHVNMALMGRTLEPALGEFAVSADHVWNVRELLEAA
jgi:hypothetical protein